MALVAVPLIALLVGAAVGVIYAQREASAASAGRSAAEEVIEGLTAVDAVQNERNLLFENDTTADQLLQARALTDRVLGEYLASNADEETATRLVTSLEGARQNAGANLQRIALEQNQFNSFVASLDAVGVDPSSQAGVRLLSETGAGLSVPGYGDIEDDLLTLTFPDAEDIDDAELLSQLREAHTIRQHGSYLVRETLSVADTVVGYAFADLRGEDFQLTNGQAEDFAETTFRAGVTEQDLLRFVIANPSSALTTIYTSDIAEAVRTARRRAQGVVFAQGLNEQETEETDVRRDSDAPSSDDVARANFSSQLGQLLELDPSADVLVPYNRLRDVYDQYAGIILDDARESAAASANAARRNQLIFLTAAAAIAAAAIVSGTYLYSSVRRPLTALTDATRRIATEDLPNTVERLQTVDEEATEIEIITPEPIAADTDDEVGQLVDAFNLMHSTAIRLAAQEAQSRGRLSETFVNLGRRNQTLLDRQLNVISDLERDEQDPDTLAGLYRLDHLATRMRRNAESLLVLAGAITPRRWDEPVPIGDVVRAALAEVEEFERVEIWTPQEVAVRGDVAADLIHLVAELVENALRFSPPTAPVEVVARESHEGFMIVITDHGVGMDDGQLEEANRRITGTVRLTDAPTRYLGLYVVGSLAARHEVQVGLFESVYGGITAKITFPPGILVGGEVETGTAPAIRFGDRPNSPTLDGHGNGVGGSDIDYVDRAIDDSYLDLPAELPAGSRNGEPEDIEVAALANDPYDGSDRYEAPDPYAPQEHDDRFGYEQPARNGEDPYDAPYDQTRQPGAHDRFAAPTADAREAYAAPDPYAPDPYAAPEPQVARDTHAAPEPDPYAPDPYATPAGRGRQDTYTNGRDDRSYAEPPVVRGPDTWAPQEAEHNGYPAHEAQPVARHDPFEGRNGRDQVPAQLPRRPVTPLENGRGNGYRAEAPTPDPRFERTEAGRSVTSGHEVRAEPQRPAPPAHTPMRTPRRPAPGTGPLGGRDSVSPSRAPVPDAMHQSRAEALPRRSAPQPVHDAQGAHMQRDTTPPDGDTQPMTAAGFPKRTPKPRSGERSGEPKGSPDWTPPTQSPEEVRSALGSFQAGVARAGGHWSDGGEENHR